MDSLRRSGDVRAWAARYPWPTLGAAAVAGIGAGWALGSATRREPAEGQPADEAAADFSEQPQTAEEAGAGGNPAMRLVSGLGTFAGAFASAAIGAATQAIAEAIKETIHDSLHPPATSEDESATGEDEQQSAGGRW